VKTPKGLTLLSVLTSDFLNAEGVALRSLNFVSNSALILASLFKNLCVKTPKGLTLLSVLTSDFLNAEGIANRRFGIYQWSALIFFEEVNNHQQGLF
jgi:hypothetical protein